MRIDNQTHWRSDQIKRLVQRVMESELDPKRRRGYRVEVTYNRGKGRGGACSGWAPYYGRMIRVMVPSDTIDLVDFAYVIAHEIGHTRGMTHRQMRGSPRYDRGAEGWREFYSWALQIDENGASEFRIEKRTPKPKPAAVERMTTKLVHAIAQLRRWESKVKRASTGAKKWRRKVQYYQKQQALAALHTPKEGSQ